MLTINDASYYPLPDSVQAQSRMIWNEQEVFKQKLPVLTEVVETPMPEAERREYGALLDELKQLPMDKAA